jgi:hypothetical protein
MAYEDSDEWEDSSDEETEDIDPSELRDRDYDRLEEAMESWPPPACLGFLERVCVVDIRASVVEPVKCALADVIDLPTAHSWIQFHRCVPGVCPRARFQASDWDTMGEYCLKLCHACRQPFSWYVVLDILRYGRFVRRAPRPPRPR